MDNEFILTCPKCASPNPIIMDVVTYVVGQHMFSGICINPNCEIKEIFACKLCYDYSRNNIIKSNAGRPVGVFTKIKTAKTHGNNTDTHKKALLDLIDKNDTLDTTTNTFNNNDFNSSFQVDDCIDLSSIDVIIAEKKEIGIGFHNESKSPSYYEKEILEKGMGAKYLVGNAFEFNNESYNDISIEEVNYFMKLTLLLTQMTQDQQKLLAEILLLTSTSKDKELSIFKNTRVPTSVKDFDDIFLIKKNAIIPNLPHPVVNVSLNGGHAYISLIDLIANEMADAKSYDKFEFESQLNLNPSPCLLTSISKTDGARNLYWELKENNNVDGNYTMYLWLKEWRDGFDPNTTKSSRNGVWMNTFTISPPEDEISGTNTYFMSISGKDKNHNEIDKLYNEEILKLSTTGHDFYHGGKKQMIKVKLGKLITCVDRPERTSMFKVGDHTGSYSKYWGYAGDVDPSCKFNHLPSCSLCRHKRINMVDIGCSESNMLLESNTLCCSDWNVSNANFSFPIPDSYPTNYDITIGSPPIPFGRNIIIQIRNQSITGKKRINDRYSIVPEKQRLPMIEMTIKWLKEAIVFSYHNLKTSIKIDNSVSKKKLDKRKHGSLSENIWYIKFNNYYGIRCSH